MKGIDGMMSHHVQIRISFENGSLSHGNFFYYNFESQIKPIMNLIPYPS